MAFTHTHSMWWEMASQHRPTLTKKASNLWSMAIFIWLSFRFQKGLIEQKCIQFPLGCKKVYSNIDHPGRKLSNRTSGTAWNEPWSRRTSTTLTRIVVKERERLREKKSRWMLVGARDDFLSEERVLRQTNAVMNWDRWCNYGQRRL